MQQSVTGKNNSNAIYLPNNIVKKLLPDRHSSAFTLIELLVVLVIVAIILTVAVMAFGDFGQSRKQRLAVLQLEQTIKAAQTQAILQPAILGLSFTETGYFYQRYWYNPQTRQYQWRPLRDDALSQPQAFPSDTVITMNHIKTKQLKKNKKATYPLIYFQPNGTITPFKITIKFSNGQQYTVTSTGSGETRVT